MVPARRLVRKKPLMERVSAFINPMDTFLWLSEELETREYDPKSLGLKFGIASHFIFVLARANSVSEDHDDLFSDGGSSSSITYLSRAIVWTLTVASVLNAYHTLTRVRLYRLFNVDIDSAPSTSSARRVPVTTTPTVNSPLRRIKFALRPESAEDRAHPDPERDVWELSVWDPLPLSLRLLALFSPAHVLVYVMSLPISREDPQPSMTVFNCFVLQTLFSGLLLILQSQYSQQARDQALINREVMHEYNTKFVHPRLHPQVRDASTQANITETSNQTLRIEMSSAVGTPTTLLHRGFQTHPNPNYSKVYDPEGTGYQSSVASSRIYTPTPAPRIYSSVETPTPANRIPQDVRKSMPAAMVSSGTPAMESPASALKARASMGVLGTGHQFGGKFGIHSHMNSPLKKSTSYEGFESPRNSREMAAREQAGQSVGNPFADRPSDNGRDTSRYASRGNSDVLTPFRRAAKKTWGEERYPSRW